MFTPVIIFLMPMTQARCPTESTAKYSLLLMCAIRQSGSLLQSDEVTKAFYNAWYMLISVCLILDSHSFGFIAVFAGVRVTSKYLVVCSACVPLSVWCRCETVTSKYLVV